MDNATALEKNTILSVNQLKSWSKCRKKFYYDYVEGLRWPTDPSNFRLGQSVHKLLDYQSRGLDCTPVLRDADGDILACWHVIKDHPTVHLPIIASEWGFQFPLQVEESLIWLSGRIDRIAQNGDAIWVIDWKTGTAVPRMAETDWQTQVYLYAVFEAAQELGLYNLQPEQMEFVYVEVKEQVREVRVPYNREKHQATRERLIQTIQSIQEETQYLLPDQCPDRFCPYLEICGIQT